LTLRRAETFGQQNLRKNEGNLMLRDELASSRPYTKILIKRCGADTLMEPEKGSTE
jgi:hypothetical protein